MSKPTIPTAAGAAFPATDIRHWMLDDERKLFMAAGCRDLSNSTNVSVRLAEYRTKRPPKKLTAEQEARESRASDLIFDYARACDPGVTEALIRRLAVERAIAAGVVDGETGAETEGAVS